MAKNKGDTGSIVTYDPYLQTSYAFSNNKIFPTELSKANKNSFFISYVNTGNDSHLAALRVGGEGGLDLAQLDALTAQLDLVVQSAAVLHRSIPSPARQVATVVQTARRVDRDRKSVV